MVDGAPLYFIVESDMHHVLRLERPDRGQRSHAHEDIPIAIEDHHRAIGPCQCDAQRNRRGDPHRPDHIKILRAVAERVRFARWESVAYNQKLVRQQVQDRSDRAAAACEHALFRSHTTTRFVMSKATGMRCFMNASPAHCRSPSMVFSPTVRCGIRTRCMSYRLTWP